MENQTYAGMKKNIAFGFTYLLPVPFAIILLVAAKDTLSLEEKRACWSAIFAEIACVIPCIGGLFFLICSVFMTAIPAFKGDYTKKIPLMYALAEKIIK